MLLSIQVKFIKALPISNFFISFSLIRHSGPPPESHQRGPPTQHRDAGSGRPPEVLLPPAELHPPPEHRPGSHSPPERGALEIDAPSLRPTDGDVVQRGVLRHQGDS